MKLLRVLLLSAVAGAMLGLAEPARAANECEGHMICVPVAGPWVVVPTGAGVRRPKVEYQLTCPRGYVVGGLDAELSHRAIDVSFVATLGSPVNPGISTSRSAVFVASYVGETARAPSFRPHIGCIPSTGGGIRIPTSVTAFPPGQPTVRRVRTVRVRPGTATVVQACGARERLVGASHAIGFVRRTPPSASLVATVSGSRAVRGGRVIVTVRGDAELGGVRAVVQVHAVCARVR
ncbi:MAG TPA: hypothetical protein VK926_08575 [Gaiellaceae bacterium]|nr:hypothetical protein [Gaiellaceae bacterium]